ncbi:hypothetical protein ON010_g614 [Phytophthora cinnamomi]|nr:hypothetical protein ON010_g614 [Phytophthora cinnamomi]
MEKAPAVLTQGGSVTDDTNADQWASDRDDSSVNPIHQNNFNKTVNKQYAGYPILRRTRVRSRSTARGNDASSAYAEERGSAPTRGIDG